MYAFKSVAKSAAESIEKQYGNYAESKFDEFAFSCFSDISVDGQTINIEIGFDYLVNTGSFKDFCLSNSSEMTHIELVYLVNKYDAVELAGEIYKELWDEFMNDTGNEKIHKIKSDAVSYIDNAIGDTVVYFSPYRSDRNIELNFSELYDYDINLSFEMDVEPDENINDNAVWLLDIVKDNMDEYYE